MGYLDEKGYLGETGIRDEVFNGNEVHHCEINKSANERKGNSIFRTK